MVRPVVPDLIERYEALRGHGSQGMKPQAFGWIVLVQRGVLAWTQSLQPKPPCVAPLHSTHRVPAYLQEPVTHVLASMVLPLYQEVHHAH